eukprot:CAMPEP_0176352558 /NCGR_PEP_ID=MMETSP0126-20121128/11115_1 /TAXON_ID=141414 ORGANISM="Strombidinopsis acuminatum, Strain SPMC142" /NCGR_SAMPLE_ID=MMETSP0126 /ASSEMBLY_ACC=CAM_ASM_000229 /LENGTH=33 /DNA_ID= /DNA_START= /DNA_END= /DNA_ORIENTATION=
MMIWSRMKKKKWRMVMLILIKNKKNPLLFKMKM